MGTFQHPYWRSVDITIQRIRSLTNNEPFCETETAARSLLGPWTGVDDGKAFLLALLSAATSAATGRGKAAKLIIPRTRGYIVRSDIIPLRMVDCPHVVRATSFAKPQQWFQGDDLTEYDLYHLRNVFLSAAGGIILDTGEAMDDMASDLDVLEVELRNRLSFPWLLKERRPKQTLAFVGNYLQYPGHGGTGSNHYSAAKALDINVIVLDTPGCWLEDSKYANLRGAFLPIDLKRNDELPNRIVDALSQYGEKIHGILTFHESLSALVARAAELLSLPTAPPTVLEVATDKYKTSVAEGHLAYHASSVDDALKIVEQPGLHYPLIVKPCRGGSSEGVSKADNAFEIVEAVKAIDSLIDRHGAQFVIEEYCNGPEVDINLVLCDGELVFLEICDDFPKFGDGITAANVSSFSEVALVYPSKLPSSELNMLSRSVHQSLLRLGFRSGVFHLEARVKDSEMAYVVQDGITDLEFRRDTSKLTTPSSWLIEINPRPPGKMATDAVESTYGIDYVSLGLLFSLNDKERIRALSHPFIQGSQYWCQAIFIPTEKGGVFDSDDVCDELQQRRPDLAQYVSISACLFRRGELVPSPMTGITAWIAYFTVFSRVGRGHLLEISESIRQEIRYSII